MKKILHLQLMVFWSIISFAQEVKPVADQNPNYKTSADKYQKAQDQLLVTMNTTVQDTYKAYDWYEAKQARKQQNVSDRRERRLARAQRWHSPYLSNIYSPFNYSPYHPFFW